MCNTRNSSQADPNAWDPKRHLCKLSGGRTRAIPVRGKTLGRSPPETCAKKREASFNGQCPTTMIIKLKPKGGRKEEILDKGWAVGKGRWWLSTWINQLGSKEDSGNSERTLLELCPLLAVLIHLKTLSERHCGERERDEGNSACPRQRLGRHVLPKYEMVYLDPKCCKQSQFAPIFLFFFLYIFFYTTQVTWQKKQRSLVCTGNTNLTQLYICRLLAYETHGRTGMLKGVKTKK